MPQDPADRRRDVAGRQRRRRHLIEQRLEQVVVVAVEERDAHRRTLQRLRGREPAEAAADDHDVRRASGMRTVHRSEAEHAATGSVHFANARNLKRSSASPAHRRRDRVPARLSRRLQPRGHRAATARSIDDRRRSRRTRSPTATSARRSAASASASTGRPPALSRGPQRAARATASSSASTWDEALELIAARMTAGRSRVAAPSRSCRTPTADRTAC